MRTTLRRVAWVGKEAAEPEKSLAPEMQLTEDMVAAMVKVMDLQVERVRC
jgi:hypothetical protein